MVKDRINWSTFNIDCFISGTLVDTSLGYREGLDKKNASASIHGKAVLFIAFFVELLKHIFS